MAIDYLTIEEIIFAHDRIIEESGGSKGVRDLNLLQSAVGRPQASFAGQDLYQDIFLKAAALIHSLILNHPFTDGNKRTGLMAASRLLFINGFKFYDKKQDSIDFTLRIEQKKMNLKGIAYWLKKHSKKVRK